MSRGSLPDLLYHAILHSLLPSNISVVRKVNCAAEAAKGIQRTGNFCSNNRMSVTVVWRVTPTPPSITICS
jgi:hypothetical protein